MMMQPPAGGMAPHPMAPPPMDQQHHLPHPTQPQPPPQWGMIPPPAPQYHQVQPPPLWNQQLSQIPPPQPVQQPLPPVPVPVPYQAQPQLQQQMQAPVQYYGVPSARPTSADEIRTLWIGDLQYWMEETYLHNCFANTGEVVSVKVIRNKQTLQSEGYGFIEFASRATADTVLQTFNGQIMPNTEQNFRLNWATLSAGERRDDSADHTIFVGDLAADVTDYVLQETFKTHYPSVKGAKVVTDRLTGRSKGYGFVKFADANEQARAMTEMNGMLCSTRPMRIGPATTKKNAGADQQYSANASENPPAALSETDPNNTTIFIGGLDSSVTDDLLKKVFGQYGDLVHVKIPVGKRCGFVQFAKRACAEEALLMLNGAQLGGQNIRLSWGRNPSNRQDPSAGWVQPHQDSSQWNSGYYGYGQGYESYGYAAPAPQDPNMYAYGAYPGYANYQQQQQQLPQQPPPQQQQ